MGGLESCHQLEGALILGLMAVAWLALEPVAVTGVATVCGQDSGMRNASLRRRGSIAQVACPAAWAL